MSICYLCSQRPIKLPCRHTWLLAHWIYLSPVTLWGWGTPRGSNPDLEGSAGAEGAAGPWMSLVPPCPALRNPGSGAAPVARRAERKTCPAHKGAESHLNTTLLRFAGGTPWAWGKHHKKQLSFSHPCQDLVLASCYKEISPVLKHIVIPSLKQPNHTRSLKNTPELIPTWGNFQILSILIFIQRNLSWMIKICERDIFPSKMN